MAECYSVTNGGVALVAATAKTVVEIATGSTVTARVVAVDVSLDASVATAGVKVELVRFTSTGTGTGYTPGKFNADAQNRAANATAKVNDTVEPGTPTVVLTYYVPNTAGGSWQLPLGRELYIPVSAFLGVRVTAAGTPNCAVNVVFEE